MTALLRRELALAVRAGGGASTALVFFLAVTICAPFAIGPNQQLLATIGPAILWLGALLASLLGLERMFQGDAEDGTLDQLLMAAHPLPLVVATKALAHWLVTGLPLTLLAPLLAVFLNLGPTALSATLATLFVGTPALSFIGAVGAALTVGLARGGLLLAVLILPLCIPTLIFGVGAVRGAVTEPAPFLQPFLFVCALSLFFAVLGPFAASAVLRQANR